MKTKKLKKTGEKSFAITGIFLMTMSLFAFSFVLSEVGVVSGATPFNILRDQCKLKYPSSFEFNLYTSCVIKARKSLTAAAARPTAAPLKTGAGTTAAKAAPTLTENIDKILGGTSTSSGTTSVAKLANYQTKVTPTIKTALEKTGLSNIQLNADGTLKSYVQGNQVYTVGQNGVLTPEPVVEGSFLNPAGYFGYTGQTAIGGLINGAAHALAIHLAIQTVGPMLGLEEETTDALSISASLGILAGEAIYGGITEYAADLASTEYFSFLTTENAAVWGWGVGIGVAVVAFILLYKKQNEKTVSFSCLPWQAPVGGSACEECNEQNLPCSEYQCKSLGQACEIINPGTTKEKCVWVNSKDVNPPTIEPWDEALLIDYRYAPDNSISPPDRGVKINYLKANDNCIPAFTPLRLGVILNEPAKCKIDVLRKEKFTAMDSFMYSGLLDKNHTYSLSLPGSSALKSENITIQNDGNYELYVRCEDANGNSIQKKKQTSSLSLKKFL